MTSLRSKALDPSELNRPGLDSLPVEPHALTGEETDSAAISHSFDDPERFAAIFDRYWSPIYRYVARRLGQPLADDLAADVFLVAFDRRRGYDLDQAEAGPWLYGIASNMVARHRRAELRRLRALSRIRLDVSSEEPADRIAGRVDAEAQGAALAAALKGLPPGDRDALLLMAWADLTSEQVARALGIPAGTVRSRVHRARKKLRAAMPPTDSELIEGGPCDG